MSDPQLEGLQTVSDAVPTRLSAVARRVPRVSALSGLRTYTMRWDTTKGNALRLASHRLQGLALLATMRSEPRGEEIAAGVRLAQSMALTGRSLWPRSCDK